jgi:hypothetical protein
MRRRFAILSALYLIGTAAYLLAVGAPLRVHLVFASCWLVILFGAALIAWTSAFSARQKGLALITLVALGSWLFPVAMGSVVRKLGGSLVTYAAYALMLSVGIAAVLFVTTAIDRVGRRRTNPEP